MLTPSCVAAVRALINGQALSTQAQRNAYTRFGICPLFVLLLLISSITLCARWPSSLPGQVLPSSNAHALSYKGAQTYFTTGQHSPNFVSQFMTQIRHGGKPAISTRKSYHNTTVCCSTQIRQRTCVNQLVLRDDWNPIQSESSRPPLKPWLLYTQSFRRGGVGFRQDTVIPHKSGESCQYWSIQSCSRIHFGSCPGAVCLRSASFRSFVFILPTFFSLMLGVLVFLRNPRCCTLWPLGEGVLVVIVTARTNPSLRVLYDVQACFVDRHNKILAPSRGQAW